MTFIFLKIKLTKYLYKIFNYFYMLNLPIYSLDRFFFKNMIKYSIKNADFKYDMYEIKNEKRDAKNGTKKNV
jgi:hypothetical protein